MFILGYINAEVGAILDECLVAEGDDGELVLGGDIGEETDEEHKDVDNSHGECEAGVSKHVAPDTPVVGGDFVFLIKRANIHVLYLYGANEKLIGETNYDNEI